MTDEALKRLIAIACLFVIAASGLFIATQASAIYAAYQAGQTASLDKALADQKRLTDLLERARR
jgi:hypothetical protein